MKKLIGIIIGLTAFLVVIPAASAEYCDPPPSGKVSGMYKDIYCDLKYAGMGSQGIDDALIEVIAEQVEYSEELTKLILDEGDTMSTDKLIEFMSENGVEFEDLPPDVVEVWLYEGSSLADKLTKWNSIFNKVDTAYQKEKVLYHTKKSMEYEFKASEKFWDGEIRTFGDAPFDLIVDLNLIEIVLFGSQAQWQSDVFTFPVEEDGGEGEGEGEFPMPEDEPEDEGEDQPTEPPEGGDVTVEVEEIEGTKPDCVPGDDPDADHGEHPGSDHSNPNCGDGKVDTLNGEECDDGNKETGDGCNQYCMLEETGADLVCQDPDAVTFGKPPPTQQSEPPSEPPSEPQLDCPPGTFPSTDITITGPPPITPEYPEYPQSSNYPGPNVGGTFKDFPESVRPPCPPGQSELKFQYGNKEESTCIPTELCAEIQSIGDEASVEFMFCVNLIKHNRPEAPYQVIEGCIDCHITAMVKAMDEALDTNVTPLENTMGSFGISNRWGPKFSFNLTTAVMSKLQLAFKKPKSSIEEIKLAIENAEKDNEPQDAPPGQTAAEKLTQAKEEKEEQTEAVLAELKNYRNASNAQSDTEFYSRITPLLGQMRDSFNRLHNKYSGIITSIQLHEKEACQF